MKRKIINRDVLEHIENISLSKAEKELKEAIGILEGVLGVSGLQLYCYNENSVVYQTPDKNYIHANYKIGRNTVKFDNIEELVVDENSVKQKQRAAISEMIDAVLDNNERVAKEKFQEYLKLSRWPNLKRIRENRQRTVKAKELQLESALLDHVRRMGMADVYETVNNVLEYIDWVKNDSVFKEAVYKRDENGNVTFVEIPVSQERIKLRLQANEWNKPSMEIYKQRCSIPRLIKNKKFCEAVRDLKRQNALADPDDLETCLENIVSNWPQLLYTTEDELAHVLGEALSMVGENNYDEQQCRFMAEGILRHALSCYPQRAYRVFRLAGRPQLHEDANHNYEHYQRVAEQYFAKLDERYGLELKAFEDLYEAVEKVYRTASLQKNENVKHRALMHLRELSDMLAGKQDLDINSAYEAASWVKELLEANVPGAKKKWNVVKKAHQTVSGDHPFVDDMADVDAIPSKYKGDWGKGQPVSDGKRYVNTADRDEMENRGWLSGGSNLFPNLTNPYMPKSMKPGVPGEEDVTADNGLGSWKNKDTDPALKNPYLPKAVVPQQVKE